MFSLNDLEPKGGCQAAIHQASPFVELQPLYCQYFKAPKYTKMGQSEKMGEYSKYLNIMMNQWILRLSNP